LFVFLSSKSKTSRDIASNFEFCFIHQKFILSPLKSILQ
jgi:hypothetical protein